MASSVIKKVAATVTGSELLRSELPETPGMKLTSGKISTATRRKIGANEVRDAANTRDAAE
jgi:hypothetical protein